MLFRVAKGSKVRPRTCWRNYVEDLAWSHLGIPPVKLPLIAGDRDAWRSQLELLPPATPKGQASKRKYTELIQCFP